MQNKGKIQNVKVYGLKESIIASGYPMSTNPCEDMDSYELTERDYKRIKTLGSAKSGSGHDCSCKGIIVQFDLTYSQVAWQQLQRYHFIDFISSMSKMHRIHKVDLKKQCNSYVDDRVIDVVSEYLGMYNKATENGLKEEAKEYWLKAVYNVPCGLELTARMTTNYLQLKTIYLQRRHHKLPEWQEFCDWCLTLPYFAEFTGIKEKGDK